MSETIDPIDPIDLSLALIRCPSITPEDHGALDVLQRALESLGFICQRQVFAYEDTPAVDNLYARLGTATPNFCFAGHTDVVPPGDMQEWKVPPFDPAVIDGELWGRGASDMKGAIAAFVAGASRYLVKNGAPDGSISLLITGDEEGQAINGTNAMLGWLAEQGEKIDHCLVGEPSNPVTMGEMIKVGRRGSVNCHLTVTGVQGHVAYPHLSRNPVPQLMQLLSAMTATPLDEGYERFQPSNLELTKLKTPQLAENVIPGSATARFNVRFNPNWTGALLLAELKERISKAADELEGGVNWDLTARISGEAFLTTDTSFTDILVDVIKDVTGRAPELSTSGGTSDARFIRNIAPVAEFGLVGATMHQTNERVDVADVEQLSVIYEKILGRYFVN